jgi:hypothetical protein
VRGPQQHLGDLVVHESKVAADLRQAEVAASVAGHSGREEVMRHVRLVGHEAAVASIVVRRVLQ